MSLHTKKPVKFEYSRPIRKGKSNKNIGVLRGNTELDYRLLDKGRLKDNEVIQKTIHAYHYWFLFLKLGLELELQNATMIMKFEQKHREIKFKSKPAVYQKIKVLRSKYKGWDLDQVLTQSFNVWWKSHRQLFSEQICDVLDEEDTISNNDRHLTLQIDTSMKLTDIMNTVNKNIKEKRKANKGIVFKKQRKYSVSGSIHKDAILNKYNALILKLQNNLSNKEIMTHTDGYIRSEYSIVSNYSGNDDYSRPIWGLLNSNENSYGAKQILVNVCNGNFLK